MSRMTDGHIDEQTREIQHALTVGEKNKNKTKHGLTNKKN